MATIGGWRRRVLIIEDHRDTRESFAMLMRILGHEALTVRCGLDAVPAARDFDPAIAFIDIGLPDISGYDVVRALRSERADRTLLVAVTGYGTPKDRADAREAGFDVHMTKPVCVERLLPLLRYGKTWSRNKFTLSAGTLTRT